MKVKSAGPRDSGFQLKPARRLATYRNRRRKILEQAVEL